jgi:choline dehydrogenase-like flavoprotein
VGEEVSDSRWSYEGLVPYFHRDEHYHDLKMNPEHHGFEGPMYITSMASRNYPLCNTLHDAFNKARYPENPKFHDGDPLGLGPWIENWHDKSRQPAGKTYDIPGVHVLTDMTVRPIILHTNGNGEKVVTGIEVANGRHFRAHKEVIISCGAHNTPQILMLSDIGPAEELKKLGIVQAVESPNVGRNFFDHLVLFQAYKLRHLELGLTTSRAA